ncbi:DsbA family protein, partial [Escherichia coli]|uniref:DsbA family protein n=1 Tax=Escherichia coli TaxID=562 RepID=UPI00116E7804
MRIDFISDVVCPWCAIGLYSLEAAAARIPGLQLDLHLHPFELNPGMGPEGQDI